MMNPIARRLLLMCDHATRVELAIKLRSGILVSREPLFDGGRRIALKNRRITIYDPRRELKPGQIAGDTPQASDPQLVYRVTGKKENNVDTIWSPMPTSDAGQMRNAVSGVKIRRAFFGKDGSRLDRRGITSRTAASAYQDSRIPTPILAEKYKNTDYEKDRKEMLRMLVNARTPDHRAVVRDSFRHYVPMIRKPKNPAQ